MEPDAIKLLATSLVSFGSGVALMLVKNSLDRAEKRKAIQPDIQVKIETIIAEVGTSFGSFYSVIAENHGTVPVTLESVAFRLPNGDNVFQAALEPFLGEELRTVAGDYELAPGKNCRLLNMDRDDMSNAIALQKLGRKVKIRAFVIDALSREWLSTPQVHE